ncbi:hypothetical protein AAG570_002072 [Ranatra chinensis]|uniref:Uncharacterized protein n=1 Tax=Ranatra chinensis TaxID=642074 RepID=A0ABD0YYL3_9HEMI
MVGDVCPYRCSTSRDNRIPRSCFLSLAPLNPQHVSLRPPSRKCRGSSLNGHPPRVASPGRLSPVELPKFASAPYRRQWRRPFPIAVLTPLPAVFDPLAGGPRVGKCHRTLKDGPNPDERLR